MSQAKVLVADIPAADEKIRDCLPGHDLHFVRTLGAALRELRRDGYQLIVIGMHFDDSRMFELLQYVRSLPQHKDVPVICVQCEEVMLSEAVLKNMEDAVKALGGTAFVDLRDDSHVFRNHCDFLSRVAAESASGLRPN
jgi:PleD family two-component response regulator